MMDIFQNAAAIVLVLGLLIFFHELGHFLMARVLGVGVKCFSLGFGPKIFAWMGKITEYRLSLVPLGGYVRLVGEEDEEDGEYPTAWSFALRPAWQRMLVVAAGPVFNFVLAWMIFWGIFWINGQAELVPRIGTVHNASAAQEAGLRPGDLILSIDGESTPFWSDLVDKVQAGEGRALHLEVQRDGDTKSVQIQPIMEERKNIFGEKQMVPMLGISPSGDVVELPLGIAEAALAGAEQTWSLLRLTVTGLIKLFQRIVPLDTVGGPIMIAQLVVQQAEHGIVHLLSLAALISINLGLLNLLPIPVLDGGHILFYAIEMVSGRPLNERMRSIAIRIGIALLVALMVLATFNDIVRTFR